MPRKKKAVKAANGTGSVYELPNHTWRWSITRGYKQVGTDADGKPIMKRDYASGTAKTRVEAEQHKTLALADLQRGILLVKDRVTVGTWLEHWLSAHEAPWKAPTVQGYRDIVRLYLKPHLGHLELQSLRPSHLKKMYAEMDEKVGEASQRKAHAVLSSALKAAEQDELILKNPAQVVSPTPRRTHKKQNKGIWDGTEMMAFLEVARKDWWGPLLEFLLATGVRRGEACGLRWKNVDLEKGRVSIVERRAMVGGKVDIDTPKTKSSTRTISLSVELLEMLKQHRVTQQEYARDAESKRLPWTDSGYVFTHTQGGAVRPDNIRRHMVRLCNAAQIKLIRIHDMRHTYASLMFRAGTPASVVSRKLGHENTNVTQKIYLNVYDDEEELYAFGLQTLMEAPRKKKRA